MKAGLIIVVAVRLFFGQRYLSYIWPPNGDCLKKLKIEPWPCEKN